MSKVGIHAVTGPRNGFATFCTSKPAVVVSVDDGGALLEAKAKSGGHTITVFRDTSVYLEAPEGLMGGTAANAVALANTLWPRLQAKWVINPADYYTITNEQGNTRTEFENLVAFERRICELANAAGFKCAVLNLASGTPGDLTLWQQVCAPFIVWAWGRGNVYGRHAYGFNFPGQSGNLVDYDAAGNWIRNGNSDRPITELSYLNSLGGRGGLIITEAGIDGGINYAGDTRFVEQLKRYDTVLKPYRDIIGFAGWTLGTWRNANCQTALPALTTYNNANPTEPWTPGCPGQPRVDYARTVHVLPPGVSTENAYKVWQLAYSTKATITGSYDDAGIGALSRATVVLWGIPTDRREEFIDWYNNNYPGRTIRFRNFSDLGVALERQPTTQPGCGVAREPYARTYHLIKQDEEYQVAEEIFKRALLARATVGFSADDAGIGAGLSSKTAAVYNLNATQQQDYNSFFKTYYPGTADVYQPIAAGFLFTHWPTTGRVITQWFGANPDWYRQYGLPGHDGIDIGIPTGTPIFAMAAGEVYQVTGDTGNYGIHVRIQHANGFRSIYAHLSQATVKIGDRVVGGQQIGLSGNTGNSTGPHLHFGIRRDGLTHVDEKGQIWPYEIWNPWPWVKHLYSDSPPPPPPPSGRWEAVTTWSWEGGEGSWYHHEGNRAMQVPLGFVVAYNTAGGRVAPEYRVKPKNQFPESEWPIFFPPGHGNWLLQHFVPAGRPGEWRFNTNSNNANAGPIFNQPAGTYRLKMWVFPDVVSSYNPKIYSTDPNACKMALYLNGTATPWQSLAPYGQAKELVYEFDHPGGPLAVGYVVEMNGQRASNGLITDMWHLDKWVGTTLPPTPATTEFGLHASADLGDLAEAEFQEFKAAKVTSVKVLSGHSGPSITRLVADNKPKHVVVRAFLDFGGRRVTPAQFVDWTKSDLLRSISAVRSVSQTAEVWVEVHNEPNLTQEGWGSAWANAAEFKTWVAAVVAGYKLVLPNTVKYLYPGLSPGPAIPNFRHEARAFFEASYDPNLWAGIGVHAYWNSFGPDTLNVAVGVVEWYKRYNKPLLVTEASNNMADTPANKAAQYVEFWRRLNGLQTVRALTYFVASASNPTFAQEVWVGKGIGALVANR